MKLGFAMPHMVRIKAMTQPWEAAVTGATAAAPRRAEPSWSPGAVFITQQSIARMRLKQQLLRDLDFLIESADAWSRY